MNTNYATRKAKLLRDKILFALAFLLLLIAGSAFSQSSAVKKLYKTAEQAMERNDHATALTAYSKILESEPDNQEALFNIGVCKFNLNNTDHSSLTYFMKSKYKVADSHFYMGKIYYQQDSLEKALNEFYYFKIHNADEGFVLSDAADQWIKTCETELKEKAHHDVMNMGANINSSYDESFPVIRTDDESLYFTSNRNSGGDEMFSSQKINDVWIKATTLNELPLAKNDICVAFSPNGNEALILRNDAAKKSADLYLSSYLDMRWSEPEKLGAAINSEFNEGYACFLADGTEIIFSSDRPGGYGGKDLYKIVRFVNGKFSLPFNLGPNVNTDKDEDFPFIDKKTNALYFSSNGHNSMGGYDVFRCAHNTENNLWMQAKNLGVTVNSPSDDMHFIKVDYRERGYFTSNRPGGTGGSDIYQVDFRQSPEQVVYCKLYIDKRDSAATKDLHLSLFNYDSEKNEGIYRPNKNYMTMVLLASRNKPYKVVLEGVNIRSVTKSVIFTEAQKELTFELTMK